MNNANERQCRAVVVQRNKAHFFRELWVVQCLLRHLMRYEWQRPADEDSGCCGSVMEVPPTPCRANTVQPSCCLPPPFHHPLHRPLHRSVTALSPCRRPDLPSRRCQRPLRSLAPRTCARKPRSCLTTADGVMHHDDAPRDTQSKLLCLKKIAVPQGW